MCVGMHVFPLFTCGYKFDVNTSLFPTSVFYSTDIPYYAAQISAQSTSKVSNSNYFPSN